MAKMRRFVFRVFIRALIVGIKHFWTPIVYNAKIYLANRSNEQFHYKIEEYQSFFFFK